MQNWILHRMVYFYRSVVGHICVSSVKILDETCFHQVIVDDFTLGAFDGFLTGCDGCRIQFCIYRNQLEMYHMFTGECRQELLGGTRFHPIFSPNVHKYGWQCPLERTAFDAEFNSASIATTSGPIASPWPNVSRKNSNLLITFTTCFMVITRLLVALAKIPHKFFSDIFI